MSRGAAHGLSLPFSVTKKLTKGHKEEREYGNTLDHKIPFGDEHNMLKRYLCERNCYTKYSGYSDKLITLPVSLPDHPGKVLLRQVKH